MRFGAWRQDSVGIVCIVGLLGLSRPASAQSTVPLYAGVAPGSEAWTFPEKIVALGDVGPVVTNVSQPTLTVFRPDPPTTPRRR